MTPDMQIADRHHSFGYWIDNHGQDYC